MSPREYILAAAFLSLFSLYLNFLQSEDFTRQRSRDSDAKASMWKKGKEEVLETDYSKTRDSWSWLLNVTARRERAFSMLNCIHVESLFSISNITEKSLNDKSYPLSSGNGSFSSFWNQFHEREMDSWSAGGKRETRDWIHERESRSGLCAKPFIIKITYLLPSNHSLDSKNMADKEWSEWLKG